MDVKGSVSEKASAACYGVTMREVLRAMIL